MARLAAYPHVFWRRIRSRLVGKGQAGPRPEGPERHAAAPMRAPSGRKLVLVTGASAGIGAAFARAYAARGFDLALVARRADRLEALGAELAAAHGIEAFAIAADLAALEAQAPVMAALEARGRSVDVLVNNAGFGIPQSYAGVPWSRQRDFLMTLAVTPCALAHAVIPAMLDQGSGSILNIASIAGFAPGVAGNTLYPGVKSLMIKFSQALDAEYRGRGLKVTAVCPGSTVSEFAQAARIPGREDQKPGLGVQSAGAVAETAVRANLAGRLVVIPGWHNQLAVGLMRALPEPLVRALINAGAARYRPKE
jgi:short-subunit dehydrogenase